MKMLVVAVLSVAIFCAASLKEKQAPLYQVGTQMKFSEKSK